MNVELLGQPLDRDRHLGAVLREALPRATAFWGLAAWAQTSGLRLLEPELRELRSRGVPSQLLIGIDGGIATREALTLSLELFTEVRVLHDVGRRTFHPKVYCVETADAVHAILGSSNLTGGGFERNYEANVLLRIDRSVADDLATYRSLCAYRDQLTAAGMPCRVLNPPLIAQLVDAGLIVENDEQRRRTKNERAERVRRAAAALFGEGLPAQPRTTTRPGSGARAGRASRARRPPDSRGGAGLTDAAAQETWTKALSASDVGRKRKGGGGNDRKEIVLNKGNSPGKSVDYLRHVFFDRLRWNTEQVGGKNPHSRESADVTFDVVIDGADVGAHAMRVTHDMYRTQDTEPGGRTRGNSPTYLHPLSLAARLRAADYTRATLTLEKLPNSYRMRIERATPPDSPPAPSGRRRRQGGGP